MEIKAIRFREDGFATQPFAFGGEEGMDKFNKNIKYRSGLTNYLIDKGDEIILVDTGLPFGTPEEIPDENTIIYTRETLNRIREFISSHPTVYLSTHTPLGYENLESKKVIDLNNPTESIPVGEIVFKTATGKYVCSICGYVYDPKVGDSDNGIPAGTIFEDLPEDWHCPRCRQGKDKFNKA